jgi:hypothetical protein
VSEMRGGGEGGKRLSWDRVFTLIEIEALDVDASRARTATSTATTAADASPGSPARLAKSSKSRSVLACPRMAGNSTRAVPVRPAARLQRQLARTESRGSPDASARLAAVGIGLPQRPVSASRSACSEALNLRRASARHGWPHSGSEMCSSSKSLRQTSAASASKRPREFGPISASASSSGSAGL